MNAVTTDEYCGTFYAAKLLGLSVGTVQALAKKNELTAWKTRGGHRRISLSSIRHYQRENGLAKTSEAGKFLKLLVVEDDVAMLAIVRSTIDGWGLPIDVTPMSSAMEALIDINALKPDVLITDLKMPGVDGFELLRTLRANPSFSSIVFIAMTGLNPVEVTAKGGLPAHTVAIQKPVDMRWLKGFIAAMLAFRQF
ncbi:MAG: response regulator receiver protein [Betaproteobacteria bacterium HGW-Betaproteobacteria-16]|nr:MAG: response regulator receiver protein [Betaproteobacteria bacterium HGW-Betaproteobacteria-16]